MSNFTPSFTLLFDCLNHVSFNPNCNIKSIIKVYNYEYSYIFYLVKHLEKLDLLNIKKIGRSNNLILTTKGVNLLIYMRPLCDYSILYKNNGAL